MQPYETAQPPKTVFRRTRNISTSNHTLRRVCVGAGVAAVMLGSAAPAFAINPGGGRHRIEVEQAAGSFHASHSAKAASSARSARAEDDSFLDQELFKLRMCESHDNYQDNTGNGYYGAYQFALTTWEDLGMTGRPDQASPDMQDYAAKVLHARAGWGPWPACSAKEGLT